jgi:hypothetical protein
LDKIAYFFFIDLVGAHAGHGYKRKSFVPHRSVAVDY